MNDSISHKERAGKGQQRYPRMFNRVERLVGCDTLERIKRAKVILFGLGGVGSWAAEALVRSGISRLTIVDADRVAESNINRQLPATADTIGLFKTDVMAERLNEINPDCEIEAINALYSADTSDNFRLEEYDYVIDAIDSLSDKAHLIIRSTSIKGVKLFSSMGAALKLDPTKIAVAEFWKVTGDPLAAALRRKFKKAHMMPRKKFKCVYSPELLCNQDVEDDTSGAMTFGKIAVNGAICHITAIFGFTLAGLVIEDICRKTDN